MDADTRMRLEAGCFREEPQYWPKPRTSYRYRVTIPPTLYERLNLAEHERYDEMTPFVSWLHENVPWGTWTITHHYPSRYHPDAEPTNVFFVFFLHQADAVHFLLRWSGT